jgi:hypothetical protein
MRFFFVVYLANLDDQCFKIFSRENAIVVQSFSLMGMFIFMLIIPFPWLEMNNDIRSWIYIIPLLTFWMFFPPLETFAWSWRMGELAERIRAQCLEVAAEEGGAPAEEQLLWWIKEILRTHDGIRVGHDEKCDTDKDTDDLEFREAYKPYISI